MQLLRLLAMQRGLTRRLGWLAVSAHIELVRETGDCESPLRLNGPRAPTRMAPAVPRAPACAATLLATRAART